MSRENLRHLFLSIRRASRLHEIAPLLSIACAIVLPQILPHEATGRESGEADRAELATVAAAVARIPYRVGPWVGQDVPIPEAARRLLRPNAMLSRRFVNLQSGMSIDLTIVHCADSRDMLGHYPPVCYPSNGWLVSSSPSRGGGVEHGGLVELHSNGLTIPARAYRFSRMHSVANESRIHVLNFFVLPDGTLTADIDDVGLRTNWLGARVTGVAQIQILTEESVPFDQFAESAGELLDGVAEVFDSLGVNQT